MTMHSPQPTAAHRYLLQAFDQLSASALYQICQAREAVFVVEQACAYQELDGLDPVCLHLQHWATLPIASTSGAPAAPTTPKQPQLAAYARIIPPSVHPKGLPAIGRVLTLPDFRGHGLAHGLMREAIAVCQRHYPHLPIYLSAQTYLMGFYQSLGFVPQGERYLEDGIEHIDMRWETGHAND